MPDRAFKPTHRVRRAASDEWVDVMADGIEPQKYTTEAGEIVWAGIWFRDVEIARINPPAGQWARDLAVQYDAIAAGFERRGNTLGAIMNRGEAAKYHQIAANMDAAYPNGDVRA